MLNVGIVEDESFMLQSLREYFDGMPDTSVSVASSSMESFLEQIQPNTELDTVLLDINLPGMTGLEGIRHLRALRPKMDIIIFTNHDDSNFIFQALCAGAVSYILKQKASLPKLREAIFTVHRGGAYMSPGIARRVIEYFAPVERSKEQQLTARQQQIVEGLVEGLSYIQIADRLTIGIETVRDHIKKIYRKLQVNSRAEVIRKKMDGEI